MLFAQSLITSRLSKTARALQLEVPGARSEIFRLEITL